MKSRLTCQAGKGWTYKQLVARFSAYSTIHGILHILAARGTIKKLVWTLLTMICIGGFVYNCYYLTINYMKNSVYVNIEVLNSRQLTFPAVSICNTSPVKRSALALSPELQGLLDGWQDGGKRRRKRDTCPNAVEPTSGLCFWMSTASYTQAEAKQYCIDQGASLAIVDSQDKFDYLFDTLGFFSTWINLEYNAGAVEWQWGDGTTLSWSNWNTDPGTPPSDSDKTCAFVSVFDRTTWKNEGCDGAELGSSIFELKAICMESVDGAGLDTTTESAVESTDTTASTTTTVLENTTSFVSSFPEREIIREDFKKETEFIETLAEIPLDQKQAMGYNFSEFILSAVYGGEECDEMDFGFFYHASHGNCYVFNSGWDGTTDVVSTTDAGRRQGLQVVLNIGQHEYLEGVTESAGAVIIVHDQHHMPFPEDEGVLATPGHITSVGVRRVDITRLGDKYSDCIEPTRNKTINVFAEHYAVNYTISACQKTCYQKHLIDICGCADPQYPTGGKALGTDQADVCDVRNNEQDDCVYGLTLQFVRDELECDCPLPCQDTLYAYKISRLSWPTEKNEQTILDEYYDRISEMLAYSSDQQFFRRNLLKVEVYFEELNREVMQEHPKYPVFRYMSGIGAIIGLWAGCSVLSLIELLEFIVDCIIVMFQRVLCSNSDSKKRSKKKKSRVRKVTPDSDNRKHARKSQSNAMVQKTSPNHRMELKHPAGQEPTNNNQYYSFASDPFDIGRNVSFF